MSLELQKIDCNCNDCKFMIRDLEKFRKWSDWNKGVQTIEFQKKKQLAYFIVEKCETDKGREILKNKADKMQFQFNRDSLLHYGNCQKFNKPICFITAICQIETQDCFEHRRG